MKRINKKIVGSCVLGLMTAWSVQANAAGYKMEFQSAATLADSGDAAVVEDAGTNWYNSAGLVYLPQQLAMSGIEIYQRTKFSGTVTTPGPAGISTTGTTNSYPNAFLPAVHYVYPFKERWAAGISIVPAWGLMEDYGNAFLRYNLNRIYTKTIDVAPSLAMRINDQWSVGLGPDFHYFSVESKNAVRTQPVTLNDSLSRYSADHWNEGWHAGLLFRVNDATRFGLNYRSRIVMHLQGYSSFGLNGVGSFETNQFKVNIPLPPTTSFSIYHDMTAQWAMMGTVSYDQWGIVKAYNAQNYQSITPGGVPILKIAVLLCDGFEETEMTKPREALIKAGATVHLITSKAKQVTAWLDGEWSKKYKIDIQLKNAKPNDYDALLLPGGVLNPDKLRTDKKAVQFVNSFIKNQKPIAAICHGPITLIETGKLKGRKLTSYHSIKTDLMNAGAVWQNKPVIIDKNLITSREPKDITAFNKAIIREFGKRFKHS